LATITKVGCVLLAKISRHLQAAKSSDRSRYFGGVNVLVFGDFHQLNPIGDRILYSSNMTTPQQRSTDAVIGHEIYRAFTVAVELTEQCRITDNVWQSLLGRMRFGICTTDDLLVIDSLVIKVMQTIS
jgi:hypothetical protein